MEYTKINKTDLGTSVIGLGTANLGVKISEKDSFALMDKYLESGGNFIDTARVYSNWEPGEKNRSERIIGDWLQSRNNRENVILATKGGHPPLENLEAPRLAPEQVKSDLEGSLKTLKTQHIDLYYLHRDDPEKPVAEIIEMLEDFKKSGKIRYYGCSNWSTARIKKALDYAESKEYKGFVANQMLWNIGAYNMEPTSDSTLEMMDKEMYQLHQNRNLAAVAYTSQAQGFFTKLKSDNTKDKDKITQSNYNTPTNITLYQELQKLTDKLNMNMTELVLNYLLAQDIQTIPIVGCRTTAQLEESLKAAEKELPPEILQQLEKVTGSGIQH